MYAGTMPVPVVLATEGLYMSGAEENMVAVPKPVQNIERSAGRDTGPCVFQEVAPRADALRTDLSTRSVLLVCDEEAGSEDA